MSPFLFEAALILVLILANGLFAMSELAIISARKARLQQRAESGDAGAKTALALAEHPTRFLSTVQIGITLVGILAGVWGGASLTEPLAGLIGRISAFQVYAREIAVFLIVSMITFLSLVLGELVPKRLALTSAEQIASAVSKPLYVLSRIGTPVVAVLDATTNAIIKLLGVRQPEELPITHEEIKVLFQQGTKVGVFEQAETNMVEGVLRLGDRLVGALMTPRTDIEWLDLDDPLEESIATIISSPHSHFPIAQGSLDNISGVIRAKDVLAMRPSTLEGLKQMVVPAVFLPESTPALAALEKLRAAPGNLAMVIDEFGGVLGMLTLFDAMEAVIGVISLEGKAPVPMVAQRDDGSWLVDGMLPVDQLKDLLNLEELPAEDRVGYQTVAGFMLAMLGEIPTAGQHARYSGWRFEVMDMDGLRIDKVLVSHDTD